MSISLQLEFPSVLWIQRIKFIRDRFGVKLSVNSVGGLLAQLGMNCRRPMRMAYEQNPSLIVQWLATKYPHILAQARQHRAELYFRDEAGVRPEDHAITTLAPTGQTPVVMGTRQRFGLSRMSAVSAKACCGSWRCVDAPRRSEMSNVQ